MPDLLPALSLYLQKLQTLAANPHATPEQSRRDALSNLLDATAIALGKRVEFVNEPKKTKLGRLDYIVTRSQLPIGYIEAEKPDADLDALAGHAKKQNAAFVDELDNFLLTNHFDFRVYEAKKQIERVELPASAKELTPEIVAKWQAFWERFLVADFAPIRNPRELAGVLARRAQLLQSAIKNDLEDKGSYSSAAFDQFKRELLPNIGPDEFADLYAQTLAYGLFAARTLNGDGGFSVETAARRLKAIPLLATLFHDFESHLHKNLNWVLTEIVEVLKRAPIDETRDYFQKRVGRRDPMIDFYEPFLANFDPKKREARGVYYTPESVVGYIVRSVDELLKRDFGESGKLGLSGDDVQILDPATGTGSFLFAIFDAIHAELDQTGSWNQGEAEKTLARVWGLELMVAPYVIAHLKLHLQLDAYQTPPQNRLGVFLSNTLDDPRQTVKGDFDLGREVGMADEIKEKQPIRVVLGNPPYSGHSSNLNYKNGDRKQLTQVGKRLERYRFVDEAPLGERNPKWLNDDYVKFIAFAQNRIEQTGEGIVAFITNHGYLDNPTFRGMRASLLDSFDILYVLDLHGNSKKRERAPDGGKDENVFAIQQGVSILLAVRKPRAEGESRTRAQVFHAELWGAQSEKYAELDASDVSSTKWQPLTPKSPGYLFVPRDEELLPEYETGWKVTDIFPVRNSGIITSRDKFVFGFTREEVLERVQRLKNMTVEQAQQTFNLRDVRETSLSKSIELIKAMEHPENFIEQVSYRPFDQRWLFYSAAIVRWPVFAIMKHMRAGINLGLVTTRQQSTGGVPWALAGVTNKAMESCFISNQTKELNYLFPLYLYDETLFGSEKRVNFSPSFLAAMQPFVDEAPPESLFHFLYAALHSPLYRARYAAFLKTDFPRVPLPISPSHFHALAEIGGALVALHTLDAARAPVLNEKRFAFRKTSGDNVVGKIEYHASSGFLAFNALRGWEPVPREVWEFGIGGYQVARKWLDDRRARTLSHAEVGQFGQILVALDETRRLMAEIDKIGVVAGV